jgi:sporulation protein YqfC
MMLMVDKNSIYIKDYQKIIFMDSNTLKIEMMNYCLDVHGRNLEIEYYDHEEIRMKGQLQVIKYDEGRV